jgi:hypothetical protein
MKNADLPITLILCLLYSIVGAQTPKSSAPKELDQLRESYQKARQQALNPIERKYEDALKAMKTRFTKDGNLEAALAVDGELTLLKASEPKTEADSSTPWFVGTWPYHPTHSIDIAKRGAAVLAVEGKVHQILKWKLEDENTVVIYGGASPENNTFLKRLIRITDTEAKVMSDNVTAKKEPTPKRRG